MINNERIFNNYKKRLIGENKSTRFNVVQYLCSFPKIDPFVMAAVLITEGCEVAFDDSSISKKENEANRKAVQQIIASRNF